MAGLYPVVLILPIAVLIWNAPFVYKDKKEFGMYNFQNGQNHLKILLT